MKFQFHKKFALPVFLVWMSLCSFRANAQQAITLKRAVETALQNNESIQAAELNVQYQREQKKTASDVGKFSATWMNGQYNSTYTDNNFTFAQTIPFPAAMIAQSRLARQQISGAEYNAAMTKNDLIRNVKDTYLTLQFYVAYKNLLLRQDSLYSDFARASSARFRAGETNLLERATAEAQSLDAKNLVLQNDADIRIYESKLQSLLHAGSAVTSSEPLSVLEGISDTSGLQSNPGLQALNQQIEIGAQAKRLEGTRLLPDVSVGYFNQSLRGFQNISGQEKYYSSSTRFQGFQLGLAFPLWMAPHVARIKAAAVHEAELKKSASYYATTLQSQFEQAIREAEKCSLTLRYYENTGLQNAELILQQAKKSFAAGEIGYIEYLNSLRSGLGIRTAHLSAIDKYNHSIVTIEYYLGHY